MLCDVCDIRLKITHSFSAGRGGKTATAKCPECGKRFTLVSILVPYAGRGNGAAAMARKLKRAGQEGKNKVELLNESNEA